ncbi:hypothetical protein CI109_101147 [Kwoniella shandongensis]|uniref:Uncharacterized protein n=1 Tax=Kwoniella shandongensis TaxID=1734106 RepID=A0A5M6CAU4_9TREE|nr:uncharacterized protein CI109_001616 [Kwoniella shandongensis]KAA5530209.1 hypothetical protein CI109_001616 [Kwoniella shandongensis]
MRVSTTLLAILSLLPFISAVTISGQIAFSELFPRAALPPSSQVSLDYGSTRVWIKHDGSFEVHHVDEGEHILEALVPGYTFQPLLITITPETSSPSSLVTPSSPSDDLSIPISPVEPTHQIHVQAFHPSRQPLPPTTASLPHPLVLAPLGKDNWFTPKGGMNVLGMLKNPMVLMMLFSGIMMFGMPKLIATMQDMDPEIAKEAAEARKKVMGAQNMDWTGSLSNMLAGTTEDAPIKPVAPAPTTGGTPNRSGTPAGGKKRRGR